MRSIDQHLHLLGEDAVRELVANKSADWAGNQAEDWTDAELQSAWEIYHGLNLLEQYNEGAKWFVQIGECAHKRIEKDPQAESSIELLHEWGMIAIRMAPENKDRFVCLPIYQNLFEAIENGPSNQHFRLLELRLQLMRHFQFWQDKGGKLERLKEDEITFIEDASQGFEEAYETMVEDAEEREDADTSVPLYRLASQYYFLTDQPNDGIACLKAALEDIDKTSGYVPALRAELLLEIGKKFQEFKKPQIALKYFGEALEIYEDAGDDFELQAAQLESWIQLAKA